LNKKGSSLRPILLVTVALLISIPAVWLAIIRMEGSAPALEIELESPFIGSTRTVTVNVEDAGSGVRKVWMGLLVQGREVEVLQRTFPSAGFFAGGKEKSVKVKAPVSPEAMGLADGKGVIRVVACDYSLHKWGKGNQVYPGQWGDGGRSFLSRTCRLFQRSVRPHGPVCLRFPTR